MRACSVLAAIVLTACQAGAPLGTTCERNDACASPLVCRFGRCRSECAAQRDCPLGTTCLLDANGNGSCALRDDPDCSVTGGSCAAPLACVGRECVNVCTLGPECPDGSECVPIGDGRARCVRTDGVDAGLVGDAGADAGVDSAADAAACSPRDCDTPLQVTVGDAFTCVRVRSGRVWCWGDGRAIARDGDYTGCTMLAADQYACPMPSLLLAEDDASMQVGPTSDLNTIDTQDTGGCVLSQTGVPSCWGTSGAEAPLGRDLPAGEHARSVQRVGAAGTLTGVDRMYVFTGSAIAITFGGLWYGWGNDAGDVLGLGAASPFATVLSSAFVDADIIVTGTTHACGIDRTDAHVVCWGSNDHGESDPSAPSATPVGPTAVAGVVGATALVLGETHSCALTSAGLTCWGMRDNLWLDNDEPTCHVGVTDCPPTPMPLGSLHIDQLVPVRHADDFCAISGDTLYCWGGGYTTASHVPTPVPDLPPIASAAIAWTHGCAISTNSDVWCWGLNSLGELGRTPLVMTGPQPAAMIVWP